MGGGPGRAEGVALRFRRWAYQSVNAGRHVHISAIRRLNREVIRGMFERETE